MELSTASLTPFWFEPEEQTGEPKVAFKLRPLTQPQINELFAETFETQGERRLPTDATWYRAGCMGLDGGREMRGITIDGKPARWPLHRDVIPHALVSQCGLRLCMDAWGPATEEAEKN